MRVCLFIRYFNYLFIVKCFGFLLLMKKPRLSPFVRPLYHDIIAGLFSVMK